MSTITELLNDACQVRDADQEKENTALRVGTMLINIIQYLADNLVDTDKLEEVLAGYAALQNGQVYWRNSHIVFLASMGAELDNVDGGNWQYTSNNGDLVYNPSSRGIRVVGELGTYVVMTKVVYVNTHTWHTYSWDATQQDMVELTDSKRPTIIDYMNMPPFSDVAIGESYYYQSGNTNRIAIKLSADKTHTFAIDASAIYVFKDVLQAMIWDPGNSAWLPISGGGGADISEILSNDWNDQSRAHVPSARQMNLMYNNMISVYNNLSALLSALANSSFKTARPVLTELDWVGNATSYSIGYNLTHCHKTDASPTSVAEGDSFTATIVPDAGYTLAGVQATGSGFSQTYDSDNDRINISASNVMNGMTIGCIAATFQVSVGYNLTGFNSESNTTMQSGGSFTKVLSPLTGYSVKTIVITMGGTNITSQVWNASTKTISIPVVTGNIVITATAEETHNPSVTLNLTGCTANNAPQEVENGNPLEIAFTKGNDFVSQYGENGSTINRGFVKNDFIVMMGGSVLEQGTDYTATQTSSSVVTLRINSVTDDVVISNLVFGDGYMSSGGAINADGSYRTGYTEAHVPIPDDCLSVRIMDGFVGNNTPRYICFYDSSKAFKSGVLSNYDGEDYPSGGSYEDRSKHPSVVTWNADAQANHKYMRCAFYCMTAYGVFSTKCIKDATNGKFIWRASDSATDVIN